MAHVRSNLNEIVAEMPQVQRAVKGLADRTEAGIKAAIAPHSKTGNLYRSVHITRAHKRKDYWVHISASYAFPANYGHMNAWAGRKIDGIHFLKAAVYGVGSG